MPPGGRHVTEREQNKGAIGKAWMRQGQPRRVDDEIAHGQQVEIERACGIRHAADATCLGLDGLEDGQQVGRGEQPGEASHAVDEVGLVGGRDWCRSIPG